MARSMVSFTDANIDAYFPTEGVSVPNELITGNINAKESQNAQWKSLPRLLLGAEIGYEFRLKNGHSIGLGLYSDFKVTTLQKQDQYPSFICITAPSNDVQPATVEVSSPISHYAANLGFYDLGIRCAYHFNLYPLGLHSKSKH